jgi:hypothetical protein
MLISLQVLPMHSIYSRCRDSSLYGRVQTILQDLILDLLKCGDLRGFRVYRVYRVFARFAFSHISRISHVSHFAHITHFAFSHISHVSHFAYIASFAHFAFQIPRIFTHLTNDAHLAFPHSSQFAHSRISRVSHFRAFCVFHILAFFALRHALPRASLGSIAFRSHVLSSSSKVHWCVSHFVSLAFHHICLCIPIYVHLSHYVFILHHPCTFSATYSAPRPGNSLSMLTRQRIVGGFDLTTLPSLRQLVRRTEHQKIHRLQIPLLHSAVASGYSQESHLFLLQYLPSS